MEETPKYLDIIFIDQKDLSIVLKETLPTVQSSISIPQLNPEIIKQISNQLGLKHILKTEVQGNLCFANNQEIRPEFKQTFTNEDILNYITAVLHLPIHEAQYKESLKTNSCKIPYPKDPKTFWELVKIGSEIQ